MEKTEQKNHEMDCDLKKNGNLSTAQARYNLKFKLVALLHLRSTSYHASVVVSEFLKSKGYPDVTIVKTSEGYTVSSGRKL